MNYSKQRNLIYEMVRSVKTHPTVEEVYNEVKKERRNISLSTVYRNLEQLASGGMLLKLKIPGDPDRYDADISEHYHVRCISCNIVEDIYTNYMKDLDERMSKIAGMKIISHNITFNMLCDKCKKELGGI